MKDFFASLDKKTVVMATLTLMVALVLATAQGCNLRGFFKVKAPPDVVIATAQTEEEKTRTITLADAEAVWQDWTVYVESNSKKYQKAVAEAEDSYTVISALLETGLGELAGPFSAIPGGTALLAALAGLTGLFIRKPGDDALIAKEKRDSYNAGVALGADLPTKTPPPSA